MTSGTDSNLCKCGRPFPDHNIEEASACGIILTGPDGCDPQIVQSRLRELRQNGIKLQTVLGAFDLIPTYALDLCWRDLMAAFRAGSIQRSEHCGQSTRRT